MSAQWDSLDAAAAGLKASASSTDAEIQSLSGFWQGLRVAYSQPETQEIVWSALDEVPTVTSEWSRVMGRAADVLQSFAVQGQSLEQQAQALHSQADHLAAQVAATDLSSEGENEGLRVLVRDHNDAVTRLNQAWQQLEEDVAADLDSLAAGGGEADEIPEVTADGGASGGGGFSGGGSTGVGFSAGGGFGHGWFGAGAGMPGQGGFLLDGLAAIVSAAAADRGTDRVRQAADLFDDAIAEDASGEDVQTFYDHIAEMSADEIEEFSEETPAVHENSLPQPNSEEQYAAWPSGEDGHTWWESLEEAGIQDTVLTHLPLLVGNVQGVPYEKRDQANQDALKRLKDNPDYTDWDDNLSQIDRSLRQGSGVGDATGQDEPMLLSLDIGQRAEASSPYAPGNTEEHGWGRQPLASISVGNPDTADVTSFGAPGMASGTHAMRNEVDMSQVIHQELTEIDERTHAVVSWVGYDAPPAPGNGPVTDVLRDDRASEGGWAFAHALDGFQETRMAGGDARGDYTVNVHAHSYGTNMSSHALTRTEYDVDTFSMYGSSGIPDDVAAHARDLHVKTDDQGEPMVFASQSTHDGTAWWGRPFGLGGRQDPTDDDFGAQVHYSGGDYASSAVEEADVTGHARTDSNLDRYGYLDEDTQHFQNLMHILGDDDRDSIVMQDEYHEGVELSDRFSGIGSAL
ncbi:alpha/beta hydrolase [Nesterenkonia suensis]